jgi:hypothetical protein
MMTRATYPRAFLRSASMPEEPKPGAARNCSIEGQMDQEQQRLVRASFAKVAPIADTAAAMFYERCSPPTQRYGPCSRAT